MDPLAIYMQDTGKNASEATKCPYVHILWKEVTVTLS